MNQEPLSPEAVMQRISTGRQYILLHLLPGEPLTADEATVQQMQMEHLARLFTLEQHGHTCIFGPVVNHEELLGIIIFKNTNREQITQLLADDPYIRGGYMTYKLYDFFSIPGQVLS